MYELVYNLLIIAALLILLKLLYPSLGLVRQDWKNKQKALAAATVRHRPDHFMVSHRDDPKRP
ncbi:hypothetical protein [Vibrio phage J14]|nr:hypothetical protein [Vibrio phage J14]